MPPRARPILISFLGPRPGSIIRLIRELFPNRVYVIVKEPQDRKRFSEILENPFIKPIAGAVKFWQAEQPEDWFGDYEKALRSMFQTLISIRNSEGPGESPGIVIDITGGNEIARLAAINAASVLPGVDLAYVSPSRDIVDESPQGYEGDIGDIGGEVIYPKLPKARLLRGNSQEVLRVVHDLAAKGVWLDRTRVVNTLVQVKWKKQLDGGDKKDVERKLKIRATQLINSLVNDGLLEKKFKGAYKFDVRLTVLGKVLGGLSPELLGQSSSWS